jgi:hypothetical protein
MNFSDTQLIQQVSTELETMKELRSKIQRLIQKLEDKVVSDTSDTSTQQVTYVSSMKPKVKKYAKVLSHLSETWCRPDRSNCFSLPLAPQDIYPVRLPANPNSVNHNLVTNKGRVEEVSNKQRKSSRLRRQPERLEGVLVGDDLESQFRGKTKAKQKGVDSSTVVMETLDAIEEKDIKPTGLTIYEKAKDFYVDNFMKLFSGSAKKRECYVLDKWTNNKGSLRCCWRKCVLGGVDYTQKSIDIHFLGWDSKWDITLNLTAPEDILRFAFNVTEICGRPALLDPYQWALEKVSLKCGRMNGKVRERWLDMVLTPNQLEYIISH